MQQSSNPTGRKTTQLVCAWCSRIIRDGDPPAAHGICADCAELDAPTEPLPLVTPAELNRLPFGIIRLTGDGIVTGYNDVEARHARRDALDVIGQHFFTEVAPCTNVQAFAGRLDAMRAKGAPAVERFGFVFRLPWTRCAVQLSLAYDPLTDTATVIVDWPPAEGAKA